MDGDYYPTESLAGVDSSAHPDLATLPPLRRTVDIDGLTTHEPAAKVVRVVRAGPKPEGSDTQAPEFEQASSSSRSNAPSFGIVGGIQERTVRSHDKPIKERAPGTNKTSSTASTPPKSSLSDQWYEADGKPISVFRKRRLIQQGITRSPHLGQRAQATPPAGDNPAAQKPSPLEGVREKIPAGVKHEFRRDPTRDPHGGAPPEAILQAMQDSMADGPRRSRKDAVQQAPASGTSKTLSSDQSLRQSVSDDNDRMMASMSQADIQEFLESVRGVVGSDTLQKFASRRTRGREKSAVAPSEGPEGKGNAPIEELDTRSNEAPAQPQPATTQAPPAPTPKKAPSKSVHFREEVPAGHGEDVAPSETHHSGISAAGPDEPQFNRHGAAVTAVFAAGRDDSTDDNDVYAIDDLLLLCRSSSAPQRRLFLTLTAQVLRLHGKVVPLTVVTKEKERNASSTSDVCNLLIAKEAAVRAALVAGWQVGDNAASLRAAALDLLSAALEILPEHLEARAQRLDVPKAGRITNPNEAAAALHALGAVHKLGANVRTCPNLVQMFSVLSFLSRWSAAAAYAVATSPASPAALTAATDLSGDQNQATSLALLDALVCSSANVAQGLLEAKPLGLQDALLRLLTTVDSSSIALDGNEQDRTLAAVKILYHLSLYGMATDLAHLLWDSLSNVLISLTAQPSAAPTLLQHTLRLLTSWTITSTDPHLTAGGHDVQFYTVREWPSFSLDVIRMVKDQHVPDQALAAACSHVSAALKGVHQHGQSPLPAVASPGPSDRETLIQTFASLASRILDEFKTLPKTWSFADVAQAMDTATSILSLVAQIEPLSASVVIQAQDLAQKLLGAKDSWEAMGTTPVWLYVSSMDSLSPRISVARYVAQLSSFAATGKVRATQRQLVLELMSLLRRARGEEQVAQYLACSLLDGQPILAPFYRTAFQSALLPTELANKEADSPVLAGPSAHSTVFGVSEPQDLKAYQTRGSVIFHTPRDKKQFELPPELRPDLTEEQEQEENDDLDPATGNPFWHSPVNGLPVRKDWPLLPLDDLLHSANSAVFNRPGSLPSDWDFTEKQIVFATLALTAELFASQGTPVGGSAEAYLPSSAELWLGLIKVYLLESQGTAPIGDKATGLVTGRDLFADPGIASMMRKVSDRAMVGEQQGATNQETLEQVASRQGIASFFQMYTDLLGVWDAQSLGDPTFARTVLQPTKMRYPSEYRLLFWRDYGHLLSTVPTTNEDVDFQAFVQPYETELPVLTHLAAALLRGQVKPSQSLLWQIAITHLAAFVFGPEPSTGRAQLTRMLFGPVGPEHVAHVQHSLLQWIDSPKQECADETTINERSNAVSSVI